MVAPSVNPRLLPPGRFALTNPNGLKRWRLALADARYSQAVIACCGDSITVGAYANNVGNGNAAGSYALMRERGAIGQLRSLFADRYGDVGEGFIRAGEDVFAGDAARWSLSGGASLQTSSSVGSFKQSYLVNGTSQIVTLATPACTELRIVAWWSDGGTAAFEYRVDGGSWTAHSAQSGSDTFFAVTAGTGLANTTHTLDIRGGSGNGRIVGAVCATNVTTGVAVHRVGYSGTVLKDFTSLFDADDTNGQRSLKSATTALGADLVILWFSANNVTAGWTTYGLTVAQVATGFARVIDRAIALGMCVLCVVGPDRNPSSYSTTNGGPPGTQAEYDAAIKAVCAARTHAACLDIRRVWGSYATGSADGLYQDTLVHPNRSGHGDIGRLIFDAIGGA